MKNCNIIVLIALFFIFAPIPAAVAIEPPSNAASTSHTIGISSTSNMITITWTAPDDSNLNGYATLWDNSADTSSYQKTHGKFTTSSESAELVDAKNHYFHIRAIANDGVFSEPVHLGPYIIDTDPNISSVTPESAASGDRVTITGTDFIAGATVRIGDTSISDVTFVSAMALEVTIPAEIDIGTYDIIVTNPNNKSGKKENFTVHIPGDINGDDRIDLADTIVGLKVLTGIDVSGLQLTRTATGNIGMAEVIYIISEISGTR